MSFIGEHKNDFLQLLIIMLIGYVLYKMVFLVSYKSYIIANWTDYRCNPMFMPLTGMLNIPDPKAAPEDNGLLTIKKNFGYCVQQHVRNQMGPQVADLKKNAIGHIKTTKKHGDNIKAAHSSISSLHSLTTGISGGFMNRIQNVKSVMNYYSIKFSELFKKLFAVFMTMIYIMKTTENTIAGTIGGPIALGMEELICFIGPTEIEMDDNKIKRICDIDVNDILKNSNRVIGITKSYSPDKLYSYNNVICTGSHIVYECGKWKKIKDAKMSRIYNNILETGDKEYKYVFNLITEQNIIEINNIKYGDYCECSSGRLNNTIREYIIRSLNNENIDTSREDKDNKDNKDNKDKDDEYNNDYYITGYLSNTELNLYNKGKIQIQNIKIGDKLIDGGIVSSIVKYDINDINDKNDKLYSVGNIIMSGNNIVKHGLKWSYIKDTTALIYESPFENENYLYSLATSTGRINIGNIELLDLNETYSDKTNLVVDNIILEYLNKEQLNKLNYKYYIYE